jgi:protein gp37
MTQSSIEWTELTWNPVTGCAKISPGCDFCYAEKFAHRLKSMGADNYKNGFKLTLHPHMLERPLEWKKPSIIFVNSMGDLFLKDVPEEFILKVFEIMNKASWHQFQILTKRPERVLDLNERLRWGPNIWMGTSVEDDDYAFRIDFLRKTSAKIKFLSLEPLLGPLSNLNLKEIDWVIVGGESGSQARPMQAEWVIGIQKQCQKTNVAFFFKQWGGKNKKQAGRVLNGRTWDEMPQTVHSIQQASGLDFLKVNI